MDNREEGMVFHPVPAPSRTTLRTQHSSHGELRCEMCGSSVYTSHDNRICLQCGYITGCDDAREDRGC